MKSIAVIIPSRTRPKQSEFLHRAVQSVNSQHGIGLLQVSIVVGRDPGAMVDAPHHPLLLRVNADRPGQAAALNAAIDAALGVGADYLAILEDDDAWHDYHLVSALERLDAGAGFYSTTQLEVDAAGGVLRVNDFPTPSGWVMTRRTWERVGPFDETFRYHLDNEWLGRLGKSSIPRVHSAEDCAPISVELAAAVRPWLANVVRFGGGAVRLVRHGWDRPLVRRLVHEGSGMAAIATSERAGTRSRQELARLTAMYGRIPW